MGTTPPKGNADYLQLGDWNATCYVCGRKFKASELVKSWKGYMVCRQDWEPRHPQDFVRARQDIQTPPWVQDQTDSFVNFCTFNGLSGIPGWAYPGCAIPGNTTIYPEAPL